MGIVGLVGGCVVGGGRVGEWGVDERVRGARGGEQLTCRRRKRKRIVEEMYALWRRWFAILEGSFKAMPIFSIIRQTGMLHKK
jgi:hypothetical protein